MTKENDIAEFLRADDDLMDILTGGIYTSEEVGVEGIHRGVNTPLTGNVSPTKDAFDADGEMLPCALVVEEGLNLYGGLQDLEEKTTSVSQTIYIYYYQKRGFSTIYAAKEAVYFLLEGARFDSYPIWWEGDLPPIADVGPVKNSMTIRQEWQMVRIRKP